MPEKNGGIDSILTDGTFILGAVTGSIYILSFVFFSSFCSVLSIPLNGFSIPFNFFISIGTMSFFILLILVFIILLILNILDKSKSLKEGCGRIAASAIILAMISYCLLSPFREIPWAYITILFVIFFLICVHESYKDIDFIKNVNENKQLVFEDMKKDKILMYMTVIMYIAIIIILPTILGTNYAYMLRGGSIDGTKITLTVVENNSTLDRDYIFVMYDNDKYFLIGKDTSWWNKSKLYIIPDYIIKKAVIKPS